MLRVTLFALVPLFASLAFPLSALAQEEEKAENKQPLTQAEKQAIAQIRKMGGQVLELAQNDNRLVVAFHLSDQKVTDEFLVPLKDLKRTVHLNLRGTAITDNGLAHLEGLTGLERLHLEKTQITDKGLSHLNGLTNLKYLNLYGTPVTDAGLEQLQGLKNLEKLYLWQTKATDEGVASLKKALAKTEINRGFVPAKPVEEKPAVARKPGRNEKKKE